MNVENIDKLIQWIRREDRVVFDMSNWRKDGFHPRDIDESFTEGPSENFCGTTCCMAGLIAFELGHKGTDYVCEGANFLEIPFEQAEELFFGVGRERSYDLEKITRDQAIEVLEILRATGEVQWDEVIPEEDLDVGWIE